MKWVKQVIMKMASEIMAKHSDVDKILSNLEKVTDDIDPDIRHPKNRHMIESACALLFNLAEDKYGDSTVEPDGIYICPEFIDRPRSYVGVTLETEEYPKAKHIVCLGSSIRTWEQLFYELAHETLHLLGPTDTNKNPVARIEEGVAVKFAEDFYEFFVFPITGQKSYSTPLNAPNSVYYKAHKLTNKIPDSVLKAIRSEFIGFKDVEKEGLYQLTKQFISESEAIYLSAPFDYSVN